MSEQDPSTEAGDQSDLPAADDESNTTIVDTNSENFTNDDLSEHAITPNGDDVTAACDDVTAASDDVTAASDDVTAASDDVSATCEDVPELSSTKTSDEGTREVSDTKDVENATDTCKNDVKDGVVESSTAKDGLTEPAGSTEPADGPGEEIESGEIPSPKASPEKPFAVECELDFEDEAEQSANASAKKTKDKSSKEADGDDDGECTDEDAEEEDLEEGELKEEPTIFMDNSVSKLNPPAKTVCRFYNRGQCFYGNNCRFLHVTTTNYSMFAPARQSFSETYDANPIGNMPHAMMNHRPAPRSDFSPIPPSAGTSQTASQPAAVETAWERGLREAKELVKKANKRKVEEPDFDDKRLNLSLVVNEKNIPEPIEDESPPYKKKKRDNAPFPKREYDDHPHNMYEDSYDARLPHPQHWRDAQFDHMEVRYHKEQRRERGRGRMDNREREKFADRPKFRDDRLDQISNRSRVDDYFDPWRRSKSPKGNLRRTRSRSGSYSSVSSYSYSSRSSCTYSRSSSRSSSRSPHLHGKRTPSPQISGNPQFAPKLGPNKFTTMKKKPGGRTHSMSRSRSRSFSRSISMDSVSSASSSISHSPRSPNSRGSILRKPDNTIADQSSDLASTATAPNPTSIPLPNLYLNYKAPVKECKVEKVKDLPVLPPIIMDDDERDPLEENFMMPLEVPFPSLQHLLPSYDKPKEVKTPHKQIKLTLLNKNPKLNNLPKKELDVNRKLIDESPKIGFYSAVKSPLSPPMPQIPAKPAPVLVPKKSASSRRDELLKQLKAVEDAIARKRAKFG